MVARAPTIDTHFVHLYGFACTISALKLEIDLIQTKKEKHLLLHCTENRSNQSIRLSHHNAANTRQYLLRTNKGELVLAWESSVRRFFRNPTAYF